MNKNISIDIKELAVIASFKALNNISAEKVKKSTSSDFEEMANETIKNFTEAYSNEFQRELTNAYKKELDKLLNII